jgi:hypothetical protein
MVLANPMLIGFSNSSPPLPLHAAAEASERGRGHKEGSESGKAATLGGPSGGAQYEVRLCVHAHTHTHTGTHTHIHTCSYAHANVHMQTHTHTHTHTHTRKSATTQYKFIGGLIVPYYP